MQAEQEIRARILAASQSCFASQGFEATSLRQICDEANVDLTLAQYYFGNKRNLFFEMLNRTLPYDAQDLLIHARQQPEARLKQLVKNMCHFKCEHPKLHRIWLDEMTRPSSRTPRLQTYLLPLFSAVREWLDQGRQQGLFSFSCLDRAFLTVVGIAWFSQRLDFLQPLLTDEVENMDPHTVAEQTWRFIRKGLASHAEHAPN